MKKFILVFLLFLVSCYKNTNDFPYPEYLGHWINEYTFVNGNIDFTGKVPHLSFSIMQSEVTLYDSDKEIKQYQFWKVLKNDSIMWLINTGDSIYFKILKAPFYTNKYVDEMILAKDSVIYQLTQ
jgi:hypothetical protein